MPMPMPMPMQSILRFRRKTKHQPAFGQLKRLLPTIVRSDGFERNGRMCLPSILLPWELYMVTNEFSEQWGKVCLELEYCTAGGIFYHSTKVGVEMPAVAQHLCFSDPLENNEWRTIMSTYLVVGKDYYKLEPIGDGLLMELGRIGK